MLSPDDNAENNEFRDKRNVAKVKDRPPALSRAGPGNPACHP